MCFLDPQIESFTKLSSDLSATWKSNKILVRFFSSFVPPFRLVTQRLHIFRLIYILLGVLSILLKLSNETMQSVRKDEINKITNHSKSLFVNTENISMAQRGR